MPAAADAESSQMENSAAKVKRKLRTAKQFGGFLPKRHKI